ncbi:MAG: restriction endonuclease, partial [Cyclobacteriaceae bacterium]
HLNLKSNSILDLYFELFVAEVEGLLHRGLVKQYRKSEGNLPMLKGSIQFSKHIRANVIHKERFYVKYTVYDHHHDLNLILYKTIKLIQRISSNSALSSRLGALLLNFPEVADCRITPELFSKITFNRKTEGYKNAISISKLLLLNYHPDVQRGTQDVLAIMFDMNLLWERFVYKSLYRYSEGKLIQAQSSKYFWKPESGSRVKMRPDIVSNDNKEDCIVLDTKWKNLNGLNPSPEDLRQMYVYSSYYKASKAYLVYPAAEDATTDGVFYNELGDVTDRACGVISISTLKNITEWQKKIAKRINAID